MLKRILEKVNQIFPANTFRKNVVMMFSGTVVSQAVYLLFYPILTRIYSTANFGEYAIFISFLSIFSVLATGQYEIPILLPKEEKSLKHLTFGAVFISVVMSIVITIILLLAAPLLERYDYFHSYWMVGFLGISIFIYAFYQVQFYLSLRNKDFKSLAFINILNVGSSIVFQWLLSKTVLAGQGLIIGYMGGTLIATFLLYLKNREIFILDDDSKDMFKEIKKQLIRYKKFPLFNLPATFVNLTANQVPQLLLNSFGTSVVGQFSLSQRVLGSPITLFSTSVSHVFKERASSDYRNKGNCRGIFVQTFKSLFLISIVPFMLIFIFAPMLVPIIFGSEWDTAGSYIRALTLMYFFKFTVSPLTYVIVVAERQNLNLLLQTVLLVLSIISIQLGINQGSALQAVIWFSLAYSVVYLLFLAVSYNLSKGKINNLNMKTNGL
ncbi:MAG: oligosaccharide flippase family protein [bacterium]